jgi:hypothetical protein
LAKGSPELLGEWLPKLVGIERQIHFALDGDLVPGRPEAQHAAALSWDTVTPAVHYLRFSFTESEASAYEARTVLPPPVGAGLAGDLFGTTKPLSVG